MVCQKCNHILKGSESYCPDCGNPCNKDKEIYTQAEAPSVIFSPDKDISSDIFSEDPVQRHRREMPEKKKSRAGLYLVMVLCAVIIGVVAVAGAELLDFTPAIASLFSSFPAEETTKPATTEADYSPDTGIVSPQVNYRTVVTYVTGSKGQALRKGPDNSYGQINILPSGTETHIVGGASVDESWVYVYIPEMDIYGWIDDAFLSSVNEEASVQNEEDEPTQSTK